ncbi:32504_t:CDS:1, partial [Racocetra persica]
LVVVTWIILLFTLAGVGSLHEEMGNCPEIKSKRESPDEKNEGFEGPMSPQFAKSYSSSPIIDVRRSGKSQEVGGGE